MNESEPTPTYSEDPLWSDVTPIPQDDAGNELAPILYKQDYKDAMGYFRAIVKAEEYSERVLPLTEHLIRLNPAHYSVWQYRYQTLLRINAPLDKEVLLINSMMGQNLKTYQIWHHRRLLQTHLRDPFAELMFITKALRPEPHRHTSSDEGEEKEEPARKNGHGGPVDTKNYHTWAYRQWLLAEFNSPELWAGELEFVEEMLRDDLRNNSAWHHRFFVVWENGIREGEADREQVLRREIDITKESISVAPNNASAWNYLRGVLQKSGTPFETLETFVTPYTRPQPNQATSTSNLDQGEETIDLENPAPSKTASLPCPLAIEFLADIYVEKAAGAKGVDKTPATKKASEVG
ncbi:CAAX geranylgeranyltransferase alpha subunit [Tulasnella sp. 331]|nr:CAAX geranylgeranyltransferase alpha subunit [Tulasnella sp. 331]KAG8889881.1 CAAX geranylgeranyltransferase alpha subunit [Tulasnella sp. 332]